MTNRIALSVILLLWACAGTEDPPHRAPLAPAGTEWSPALPASAAGALQPGAAAPAGLAARIAADEARIAQQAEGWYAVNRAAGLRLRFAADGTAHVAPREAADGAAVSLRLTGVGRPGALTAVGPPALGSGRCADEARVGTDGTCLARLELARPGVVEWYDNRTDGVEHGVDLEERPAGAGPLVVRLAVLGGEARQRGAEAVLRAGARDVAAYGHLVVRDAAGVERGGAVIAAGAEVRLEVDDAGLMYPLVVDPLLSDPAATLESDQANARSASQSRGPGT